MTTPFIGFICGLNEEAKALPASGRFRVAASGASAARAYDLARAFISEGAAGLVSFGVSGALDPALKPGVVFLASRIVDVDGREWTCDDRWRQDLLACVQDQQATIRQAPLLGVDDIIATPAQKADLFVKSGARAVDMESHSVAKAAEEGGTPFIAIRAIADPADRAIPLSAQHAVTPEGDMRPLAVLRAALARPADFPGLLLLGRDTAAASAALRDALRQLFPALIGGVQLD